MLTINQLYTLKTLLLFHKLIIKNISSYFTLIITGFTSNCQRTLRKKADYYLKTPRTNFYLNSPINAGLQLWNKFRVVSIEVSVSANTVSAIIFYYWLLYCRSFLYQVSIFVLPIHFKRKIIDTRYQYFSIATISYLQKSNSDFNTLY